MHAIVQETAIQFPIMMRLVLFRPCQHSINEITMIMEPPEGLSEPSQRRSRPSINPSSLKDIAASPTLASLDILFPVSCLLIPQSRHIQRNERANERPRSGSERPTVVSSPTMQLVAEVRGGGAPRWCVRIPSVCIQSRLRNI